MRTWFPVGLVLIVSAAAPAWAQFKEEKDPKGVKLGKEVTQRLMVGLKIKAHGGPCQGMIATVPMPTNWPEQEVRIVQEDFSANVGNVRYRMLGGTVKQMVVEVPQLPVGQEARAIVTLEITRRTLVAPEDTSVYSIPKKLDRNMQIYLGPSPFIESRHPKITAVAKELANDRLDAWKQVETIYDWVRAHVEYKNGPLKGALRALNDKTGDCEELTSLFIAICRASKIPARSVWVDGHCYPEFYLVDDEGQGHWFPCQSAGERDFGGITEEHAILQKGDNFKDPDRPREKQRYVSEFIKGSSIKGGGEPKVTFIRDTVGS